MLTVGTNVPTPLYARYQQVFGFTSTVVTLIFAVYAVAMIPTLLFCGGLADRVGHRRVVIPAVLLAIAAASLFAFAHSVAWLFAARVLQGVSVGAASSALTAALVETEPSGNQRRASLLASAMITGGGGIGPVLAGALSQYAPAPLQLCYVVELILLTGALAAVATLPSQSVRPEGTRLRRPHIPSRLRRPFAIASAVSFLGWSVVAVFLAIVPTYASTLLHCRNLLLSGTASGMFLLCAATTQYVMARSAAAPTSVAGLMMLAAGLVALTVAGWTQSVWVLFVAAVCGGSGQGVAFMGAIRKVNELAPHNCRAEMLSAFYVVTYLGVGIPVIGIGFLEGVMGLFVAVAIFSVATALGCLVVAVVSWRADRFSPS
ncbi:MFS transporter [Streptomyces sioyaensis]|uniref:MFS transporter n=1 Tax=Streptomyces sioyaensis TaxID=67364 RepID=UPI00365D2274